MSFPLLNDSVVCRIIRTNTMEIRDRSTRIESDRAITFNTNRMEKRITKKDAVMASFRMTAREALLVAAQLERSSATYVDAEKAEKK